MLTKLVLALLLVPVGVCAATPTEIADCKVYKVWQFADSADGWRPDHNVSPFKIKGGVLSFANTGGDPWIINFEVGGADTSKYGFLGMRMRSSASGTNQVFFATDKSALSEGTSLSFAVKGDGQFHFYEVNLSKLKTWTGKLNVLRIDTVNGGLEVGAKVDIDWIALYQTPARIVLGRPSLGSSGGETWAYIQMRNAGGQPTPPDLTLTADGSSEAVPPMQPGDAKRLRIPVKPDELRDVVVSGRVKDKTLFVVAMPPRRTSEASRPQSVSGRAEIVFYGPKGRFSGVGVYGGSALLFTQHAGRFDPLGTLVYRDRGGTLHYDVLSANAPTAPFVSSSATLLCKNKLPDGTATIEWRFELSKDTYGGHVTCTLSADAPLEVLRFEGPRLRVVMPVWSHGLFPGLQYLEANERYSAERFIGPKLADQHIPHPYKVTVPVMAAETRHGVLGLTWDPLQEWAPGHTMPCAQFEPKKGMMTIFAPSIPDYVDENQDYATTPYTLKPGQKMTLKMGFFVEPGKRITDVIPDYLAAHPLKSALDSGKVEKAVDTCSLAYAGSLYSKGWKSHFGLQLPYVCNPAYAANVLAESLRKSDPAIAAKCDIDPNAQLSRYTGTSMDWFTPGARAAADAAIARQAEDGGFAYAITDALRKKTRDLAKEYGGIEADTLGTVGETNSGLIARELGSILTLAVRTGEQRYIDAGLKGLAKMNSFTVPRGAQTWEVHAHAPDVYAASLAIDCNIAGYHLTGDSKYLDQATFWAKTGLPFIYTWTPPIDPVPAGVLHFDENGEGKGAVLDKPSVFYTDPKRHVNPGASIAVFGSSFYFVNWFGTPVQWCGLAWADSVQALMRLRPDRILQSAADAVFASGLQQQFDKGFAAGTYPDSWNLLSNTASTAFIAPDTILPYAYGWLGEKTPSALSTAGFRRGAEQACLNTFARIESFDCSEGVLRAKLKFFANQDVYSSIAKVDSPSKVEVDGVELASVNDLRAAPSGWFYDAQARALHVKYRSKARMAELKVTWATLPRGVAL